MPWQIEYDDRVVKQDIPALDAAIRQRVREAIEQKLTQNPLHFGKPLRYSFAGQRSLRVGDYRVVYALDVPIARIKITAIRHRREVYED